MTREIIFRGKRLDNGEWETGSLVIVRMGCHDEQCFIADKMTGYHTPIDPSTIGQYTGLKDKDGREIFEGDILVGAWRNTKLVIYFDEDYLQFRAREVSSYARENAIDYYNNGMLEVIGIIHDNPELLEV